MVTRRSFLGSVLSGSAGAFFASGAGARPPDIVVRLAAGRSRVAIRPGEQTEVLRFGGEVLEGRGDALLPASSYLGPTLNLRRGERIRIEFENRLQESTVVHWHGLIVPEAMDEHSRFAVPAGGRYTYEFDVMNPAGTYLYHPHGRTGH